MDNTVSQFLGKAVPAVPFFLGLMGAGMGVYSLTSPYEAIHGFGLRGPPADKATPQADAYQKSLIYAYGIRNLGVGLGSMGLFAFGQFHPLCHSNPVAAAVARKALGLTLLTGTVVGLLDAWLMRQYAQDLSVVGEAKEEAKKASTSHAMTAVVIFATGLFLYL